MSETEKKQTQTARKAAVKEGLKKTETVVYIGPDIPGAKQYTVFNNGLPDALKEKIKRHPVFHSLVIPVEKLPQASVELAKEGSAMNIFYKKAQEANRKEG